MICAVRVDDYENHEVDADIDCDCGYADRSAVLARGDDDGDVRTARRAVPQWVRAGQELSWNGGWDSAAAARDRLRDSSSALPRHSIVQRASV